MVVRRKDDDEGPAAGEPLLGEEGDIEASQEARPSMSSWHAVHVAWSTIIIAAGLALVMTSRLWPLEAQDAKMLVGSLPSECVHEPTSALPPPRTPFCPLFYRAPSPCLGKQWAPHAPPPRVREPACYDPRWNIEHVLRYVFLSKGSYMEFPKILHYGTSWNLP